jgi:hypothetical protein
MAQLVHQDEHSQSDAELGAIERPVNPGKTREAQQEFELMSMGSRGVGGRRYQVVAVVLTYLAVSLSAVPIAIHQMRQQHHRAQAQSTETAPQPREHVCTASSAFLGTVTYSDIFGHSHSTQFCTPFGVGTAAEFSSILCIEHNDVDRNDERQDD